jgi:hypothetical protein
MNAKHIESRADSKAPSKELNCSEQGAPQANDAASTVSDETQKEKISFWEAACYWALARR